MKKTLSVSAIENGTVIDHIAAGQALRIVELLCLSREKVTIGLNLPSKSMGVKDLLKIEGRELSEEEAYQVALFAPKATLSIIRNYETVKKFSVELQSEVRLFVSCPNSRCITNHESAPTRFGVVRFGEQVELTCCYCQRSFSHDPA